MPSPFAEVFEGLRRAFQDAGVGWYLFGAQAALIHGAARFTADVDVTVHLGERETGALVDTLSAAGFEMRIDDPDFIQQTRVLPALHTATGIPVDIVLGGPGIEELFLERSQAHDLDGVRVPVARAEDVIVMKVLAGRPKDLEDVAAILAAHVEDLDHDLVRETLRLLEGALAQSDLLPELERQILRARAATPGAPPSPKRKRKPKPR